LPFSVDPEASSLSATEMPRPWMVPPTDPADLAMDSHKELTGAHEAKGGRYPS